VKADRIDRALGRLVLRVWAVIAWLAAAASIAFGALVLGGGHLPGVALLLLGALFVWLGRRAWRDPATLGGVLNRDFERPSRGGS
jgi:hypothetical protein